MKQKKIDLKKYASWIIFIVLVVFFSATTPNFRTAGNMITILRQVSIIGIMSVGMAMVLLTGGLDLSIGAQIGLTSTFTAMLIVQMGISPVVSILLGLLLCTFIGFVNGMIITYTGMPAMIATLGMTNVIRGLAYIITGGIPVYGLPPAVAQIGQGHVGSIPIPVIIMAVIILAGGFVLNKTFFGRYIYALGSNKEAARLSGLKVNQIQVLVYTICGFLVGIAGIVMMGRVNSGQPIAGQHMEMDAITACVVGGCSSTGGEGRVFGILGGVLVMGVLSNGMAVMGLSEYPQMVMKGLVLILAVGFDHLSRRHVKKNKKAGSAA